MPSTVIRAFTYDPDDHRLDVEFVTGKRYSYHDVPERVAQGMREAFSKGSYFNLKVRDNYQFTKLGKRISVSDE